MSLPMPPFHGTVPDSRLALAALLGAAVLASSCGGDAGRTPDSAVEGLAARLGQIEKRLAKVEDATDSIAALTEALTSLDRRLAAAELKAEEAWAAEADRAATAPAAGSPAAATGGGPRREMSPQARPERREELRALNEAMRARMTALRERFGNASPSPERREAMREMFQWYMQRRREAMRGGAAVEIEPAPTE
jgi:hypothetical protein